MGQIAFLPKQGKWRYGVRGSDQNIQVPTARKTADDYAQHPHYIIILKMLEKVEACKQDISFDLDLLNDFKYIAIVELDSRRCLILPGKIDANPVMRLGKGQGSQERTVTTAQINNGNGGGVDTPELSKAFHPGVVAA